ncbi:methyl-accepting chemotaxis protein [Pseudoalteromonas denitrificans]|uniref:Methyl-accepting chemotaxis protein n=1 Tax=Pseudoalteromonas denitrificans DSM 6059 TaxID=1123010 RepID=A0A1I1IFY4_9GAMM|nr:HAMP domain-containing methyl-accepting chemotaxis protein [Pseudoalteromonas denitrificans]SFC35187.1 methyl-accepting chemotaxis protein [Pseudoalteromonas denitrificans DSM 6059]
MTGLKKIAQPATKLMEQLKYSKKIALVFGILLVPLSLSLFFLNSKLATSIEMTHSEIKGLKLYPKILTSIIEKDDSQAQNIAKKAGYKINKEDANKVLEAVSIQSFLAILNNLASSYLNRALVESLPKLIDQTRITSEQTQTVLAAGSFTPESYIALSNSNKSLPLALDEFVQKITVATNHQSQIKKQLQSSIITTQETILSFKKLIDNKILEPDEINISLQQFKQKQKATLENLNQLINKILPVLNSQLEQKLVNEQWIYRLVLLASILSLSLAFYLMLGFYCSVVDAIKNFSKAVNKAAKGDLKAITTLSGNDELTQIGEQYNTMLVQFSDLVDQAKNTSSQLGDATQGLTQVSEKTRIDVTQQQQKTTDINALLSEMTSSAQEVESKAQEAVTLAQNAGTHVKQGTQNTISLANHMEDLQTEFEQSRIALDKLAEDSQNISKVSLAISGIAEQTNLLALNAAIEAARAGEQGRGFAVVADEVRTLAQRTQQQTEEIHTIISSLQTASNDTQSKMQSSVEKMEQGVLAANQTREILNLAEQGMLDIDRYSADIVQLSTSQTHATEQALNRSIEIDALAQDTLSSAQSTEQESTHLSKMSADLQDKMAYFK